MWLNQFRTEYNNDIQVSKPELTTADLVTFQKEIGGLIFFITRSRILPFKNINQPIISALRLMKRLRDSPFNMPLPSRAKSISWLTNGLSLA